MGTDLANYAQKCMHKLDAEWVDLETCNTSRNSQQWLYLDEADADGQHTMTFIDGYKVATNTANWWNYVKLNSEGTNHGVIEKFGFDGGAFNSTSEKTEITAKYDGYSYVLGHIGNFGYGDHVYYSYLHSTLDHAYARKYNMDWEFWCHTVTCSKENLELELRYPATDRGDDDVARLRHATIADNSTECDNGEACKLKCKYPYTAYYSHYSVGDDEKITCDPNDGVKLPPSMTCA